MKPAVLVCRAVFPDVVDRLREHFEVEDNPSDEVWSKAELIRRLHGKVGAFTTGSDCPLLVPRAKPTCVPTNAQPIIRKTCDAHRRPVIYFLTIITSTLVATLLTAW